MSPRLVPATVSELARIPLFSGFSGRDLTELAAAMRREQVTPGAAVVREGEDGDRFYALLALSVLVAGCGSGSKRVTSTAATAKAPAADTQQDPPAKPLAQRAVGTLAAPLQDAASAGVGGAVVLLGGLNAADTSTDGIFVVRRSNAVRVGRLPGVLHDAAAAALGRSLYVFGGGNGPGQLAS